MIPPGPRGWLPGRALLSFPREPEAFWRVAKTFGDLSSWRVGRETFFLVNHPDLVREAFVTKHDRFVKGWGPQRGNTILGNGLITAEGDQHRASRRLLLPGFHRQRIEEYFDAMLQHARGLRDRWSEQTDVLNETRITTLGILGDVVFDTDLSNDLTRLTAASDTVFRRFSGNMSAFAPLLRRLRWQSQREGRSARNDLAAFASRVLAEKKSTPPGTDIVSMLLAARDETAEPLADEQIRDEITTFFFAGHETVSITLAWAWRLLAQHPAAQSRLHSELDSILGARELTVDDVRRLPYTQGVIAETLRLYPPQWMIGRRAIEPVEIGGYEVPRGAIVLLCLPALHRDARWFDDPEEFRPERWLGGVEKSAAPFTFLPFGAGVRRCIGEGFAWMEASVLLSVVAARFAVEPIERAPMESEPLLLLRPKGAARLRFRPRSGC